MVIDTKQVGVAADWRTVVRAHGPVAFQTAWRLLGNVCDTEDVVQEALLEAFQLHRREHIHNWPGLLRHLATQRAIDRLRRRGPSESLSYDPIGNESDRPESMAIERELSDCLRKAVGELPDREATVFSLRCFGELTNAEIAEALSISAMAVGVALHKARAKLKQRLKIKKPTRFCGTGFRAQNVKSHSQTINA